jgi:hypothetical protein
VPAAKTAGACKSSRSASASGTIMPTVLLSGQEFRREHMGHGSIGIGLKSKPSPGRQIRYLTRPAGHHRSGVPASRWRTTGVRRRFWALSSSVAPFAAERSTCFPAGTASFHR